MRDSQTPVPSNFLPRTARKYRQHSPAGIQILTALRVIGMAVHFPGSILVPDGLDDGFRAVTASKQAPMADRAVKTYSMTMRGAGLLVAPVDSADHRSRAMPT